MKQNIIYSTHFISAYKKNSFVILFVFVISSKIFAQIPDPPIPIPINASITLEKNQASSAFGNAVAGAGDVNGDGFEDVVVGAPLFDNGQTDEGAAFLYYGSEFGLSATPGWFGQSNQIAAQFGYSVSGAGDVNNDGYSDVIIGAPFFDNGHTDEGKAYLYLGSASGLSLTPIWTGESDQINAHYGYDVCTAGDVNNDGFDDIIVGSPRYDSEDVYYGGAGIAFIYTGNADGVTNVYNWSVTNNNGESNFGNSVSTAGDVNGDGFSDIIVGAYSNGFDGNGAAYLYHGSEGGLTYAWADGGQTDGEYYGYSVSTAGDVNGDGYSDVVIGGPDYDDFWWTDIGERGGKVYVYYGSEFGLSEEPDWTIATKQDDVEFGFSVSHAGDVNNDGFDDIIIGSKYQRDGHKREGFIFIYTGSAEGLPGTTAWQSEANQVNAYLGTSVSSAGDTNGDGFDDFIAGAPNYDNGQSDEGQVKVFLGEFGCVEPPVVTLNFADPNVCLNDAIITLTDGSPSGGTYTGTGIIGGYQFDPIVAGVGTHMITYTYIAPGGCSSTASNNLTVDQNPVATNTLGSASLNLCTNTPVSLVANTGVGLNYQWYKNGAPIAGETNLVYLAYSTGNYQVLVTNILGCSTLSPKRKVTQSGCKEGEEINTTDLVIYPNPNNGEFNFTFSSKNMIAGDIKMEIFDITGRLLQENEFYSDGLEIYDRINSDLPSGIYTIKLFQGNIFASSRFVIN